MTTLKEEAQEYTPKQTLNIADLDRVDLSFPIETRTGVSKKRDSTTGEEKEEKYVYKVMIVNGIEYRVPFTVLEEIQKMLELKPDLTHVKVLRSGTGLSTRYSVKIA